MSGLKIIDKTKKRPAKHAGKKNGPGKLVGLARFFLPKRPVKESHIIWSVMLLLAVVMFTLGLAIYPFYQSYQDDSSEKKSIFIDMKVVDAKGHPVSGALVFFQNKSDGHTDTFGEWKKFYQFDRVGHVTVKIKRNPGHKSFDLVKNLIVPTLSPSGMEGAKIPRQKVVLRLPEDRHSNLSSANKSVVFEKRAAGNTEDQQGHKVSQAMSENLRVTGNEFTSVWFTVLPSGDHHRKTMILKKFLLPALRKEAKLLGLEVKPDSDWQAGVMHIPGDQRVVSGFEGVIRVIGRSAGNHKTIDFLRNYTGNSQTSAKGILKGLKQHIPKKYKTYRKNGIWFLADEPTVFWTLEPGQWLRSDDGQIFEVQKYGRHKRRLLTINQSPCPKDQSECLLSKSYLPKDPPNLSWGIVSRTMYGFDGKGADVYFGGYRASYHGKHQWRFWARPGYSSYLSVIHGGKIVYRRLIDGAQKQPIVAQIPWGNQKPN